LRDSRSALTFSWTRASVALPRRMTAEVSISQGNDAVGTSPACIAIIGGCRGLHCAISSQLPPGIGRQWVATKRSHSLEIDFPDSLITKPI
jgi:hypothetical protein